MNLRRKQAIEKALANLRLRLLDLSNRNKILSFKHSDRSRTHIRIIDELPDVLFKKLVDGKPLRFRSLPEPEDDPKDEKTDRFLMALEEARLTDEEYLEAIQQQEEDELNSRRNQEIERSLKDRVREKLRMPLRRSPQAMSMAEYAKNYGLEPNYSLPLPGAQEEISKRHGDNEIQTLLLPDQMDRKLSGITEQARTVLQETGVNTLYCIFGFLEWYEAPHSDTALLSPLLLYPIEIERILDRSKYRYSITSLGEEIQANITLAARLLKDFGLKLPDLKEEEAPESYFRKIQEAIKEHKRWCVRRYITIGHFSFARLVMYEDLNPTNWAEPNSLAIHSVISELLGGTERIESYHAEEYEADHPEIARKVPLLITDADSSQFSALVDALEGKNLVIQGPPGTGKSQTITNLIAAALAMNKKVLFVAEKMAALDVVKKRLNDAGTGDFCLELHSTRAKKRDVLDSLAARLKIQNQVPRPKGFESSLQELENIKQQLSLYVATINQPIGNFDGLTIHDLLWKEQNFRKSGALPKCLEDIKLKDAKTLDALDLDRAKNVLRQIEHHGKEFSKKYVSIDRHPWSGMTTPVTPPH